VNANIKNCQTEVESTTIDKILADAGVKKVDVLKIDVEGFEVCLAWLLSLSLFCSLLSLFIVLSRTGPRSAWDGQNASVQPTLVLLSNFLAHACTQAHKDAVSVAFSSYLERLLP
jgi:hypothetical protein